MTDPESWHRLWLYLSPSPLLWLSLTVLAFRMGQAVQRFCRNSPFANPVLIAIVIVVSVLRLSGTRYDTYFAGAQFIHFLLGPATVALAVPLANNIGHLRRSLHAVVPALMAGSATALVSGVALVRLCGGSREIAMSMAPKAVTTPIAMALAQADGGLPSVTAVFAILGGIVVALVVHLVMKGLKITDWRAYGLAAGTAGSGIAAARVLLLDDLAGAFAGLAVGLNGIATAFLLPLAHMIWAL